MRNKSCISHLLYEIITRFISRRNYNLILRINFLFFCFWTMEKFAVSNYFNVDGKNIWSNIKLKKKQGKWRSRFDDGNYVSWHEIIDTRYKFETRTVYTFNAMESKFFRLHAIRLRHFACGWHEFWLNLLENGLRNSCKTKKFQHEGEVLNQNFWSFSNQFKSEIWFLCSC